MRRRAPQWLHVVDLAASRDGEAADIQPLLRLLDSARQSVQTGGGVRKSRTCASGWSMAQNASLSAASVSKSRNGSPPGWKNLGRTTLVAALDVRIDEAGIPWPRTHGWTQGSDRSLWHLLDYYANKGLRHVLCTDISRDGAMTGPNLELYREISTRYPGLAVQASGGVSGLADLKDLTATGADSAITGKALLEGCFTVSEAMEVLS